MSFCKIESCPQRNTCESHCIYNAGLALAEFLAGVDCIETKIGEIRTSKLNGEEVNLIASGIMLEDLTNPSNLLSPISLTLDLSPKFIRCFGKSPMQILNHYLDTYCIQPEQAAFLRDKLNKLLNNKLMAIPVKPNTKCSIRESDDSKKWLDLRVEFVKYFTDPETGKFKSEIISTYQDAFNGGKRKKASLTDYGKKFKLTSVEIGLHDSRFNRDVIAMTEHGFIRPILFRNGDYSIAVDGTYVYYISNSGIEAVAQWNMNNTLIISDKIAKIQNTKAYKEFKRNEEFIMKHRRFIAPYEFLAPTIIDID